MYAPPRQPFMPSPSSTLPVKSTLPWPPHRESRTELPTRSRGLPKTSSNSRGAPGQCHAASLELQSTPLRAALLFRFDTAAVPRLAPARRDVMPWRRESFAGSTFRKKRVYGPQNATTLTKYYGVQRTPIGATVDGNRTRGLCLRKVEGKEVTITPPQCFEGRQRD
ncbi:hypothetical protein BDZ90DRAFT_98280 [Jaminaea rosea]|uniref:Uncharacterized protein n=1 Tax=Jaminaea rosea TaxID=1569628 RepID=A0A316UKQ4_9BASI|nr:hypothetical protein BDZ90DRAFT_98280 [Jaminaea rosea]PWN24513.1 hypothetical protein BDZ90DRAFT_98280 [Jaminaea rosea]